MPLKIPEGGLLLSGPGVGEVDAVPTQAFPLILSESMIADLIIFEQDGGELELSLGAQPSLLYGSKSHRLTPLPPSQAYDLYLTKPYERLRAAEKIPHTMSLWKKFGGVSKPPAQTTKVVERNVPKQKPAKASAAKQTKSTRGSMDRENGTAKRNLLATTNSRSTPMSLPSSPALGAANSPSLNPVLSASQQAVEKSKQLRVSIVHELASGDKTEDYLRDRFTGGKEDFNSTLKKVADLNNDTQKYSMKKTWWKELDVWKYDYESSEDRDAAVENAISQYDKMRITPSEPEWQRLLPVAERNKGKCLSRLQAKIAKENAAATAPKISVQHADGSNGDATTKDDSALGDLKASRPRGESMSRSSSNPLPSKAKKSGSDAQVKRLLNNTKKTAVKKSAAAKTKEKVPVKDNKKVLSAEFIENSDSDEDAPLAKKTTQKAASSAPVPKKTVASPAPTTAPKPARPQPKTAPKPAAKPALAKRAREDDYDMDDSSSSSGTPLSKRLKTKQTLPPRPSPSTTASRNKTASSSQTSRVTSSSNSSTARPSAGKTTTSPAKSSPLASSPPTNASDIEDSDRQERLERENGIKRRKVEDPKARKVITNGAKSKAIPQDLLEESTKFKKMYDRYIRLHYEIVGMADPPMSKVKELRRIHEDLKNMKEDITAKAENLNL